MKRTISLILTFIMLLSSFFCVDITSHAASAEEEYQTYLADYLLENRAAQDYINLKNPSPYRMYVEQQRNNVAYDALVTAWRAGTFSLSDITKYADKEVAYYEAILFDILLDDTDSSSVLNDIDNLVDSVYASSFKKLYTMFGEIMDPSNGLMQVGSQNYSRFMTEAKKLKGMAKAFEAIDNIGTYYSYCTDTADFIRKCAQVQAVAVNYTMLGEILSDISSRTSNLALKAACTEFRGMIDSSVSNLMVQEIFIERKGAKILAEDILDEIWKCVLDICGGYGFAISAGQAMGKIASNLLFSTEDGIEKVYSMYALYDFEDILTACLKSYQSSYSSSRTVQNAYKYNEAFRLFLKVQLEGANYARDYISILYDGGLVYRVYKVFKQNDYNIFMQYVLNYENMVRSYLEYINTGVFNSFLDIYYGSTDEEIIRIINASKRNQSISKEAYNESITYIKAISTLYYGLNIKESTTLTEDVISYADCVVSANLDLNGHTITVSGDMVQRDGELKIGSGKLEIGGDYRVQKPVEKNDGTIEYTDTDAILTMENEDGKVIVKGDMYFEGISTNCIAGEIELYGDFHHLNGYYFGAMSSWTVKDNFQPSGTHKVILKGKNSISFESNNSYFNILELSHQKKYYTFSRENCWNTLIVPECKQMHYIIPSLADINATLTVKSDENEYNVTASNGVFDLDGIKDDVYRVYVTQKNALTVYLGEYNTESGEVTNDNAILLPLGDVNGDGVIDVADLSILLAMGNYGQSNTDIDLTGDSLISIDDISLILQDVNYGKSSANIV